jgi:hypothetical protein
MPRGLIAVLVAVAVGLAGYTVYWFDLKDRAALWTERWRQHWLDQGVEVTAASQTIGGFPYRLVVEAAPLSIASVRGAPAWRWSGARVRAIAQPWTLNHWIALVDGDQRLELDYGGRRATLTARAQSTRSSLVLADAGDRWRSATAIRAMTIQPLDRPETLTIATLEVHARRPDDQDAPRIEGALAIESMTLPDAAGGGLGRDIQTFRLDGRVNGPGPDSLEPAAIIAWRDAGGTLDVHALALDWGPLIMSASGTLALDSDLRPIGAFNTRMRGFAVLIDRLIEQGTVDPLIGQAAKAALYLLADNRAAGGPVLAVPITLQDGWLSVGPVPLIKLEPIFPAPGS